MALMEGWKDGVMTSAECGEDFSGVSLVAHTSEDESVDCGGVAAVQVAVNGMSSSVVAQETSFVAQKLLFEGVENDDILILL